MKKSVDDILRDGADTYQRKTADYGSSWRSIGYILREMAHDEPIVLDSPEEIIAFGLFTRRLDKLSREFFGTFFADDMNFEGPVDSAEDESVYGAMSAANLRDMAAKAESEEVFEAAEGYTVSDGVAYSRPPEYSYDFEERVLLWADDLVAEDTVLFPEDFVGEFPHDKERDAARAVIDHSDAWSWDPALELYSRA